MMADEQTSEVLSRGRYVIRSKIDSRLIGRNRQEDKSLAPKRIVVLEPHDEGGNSNAIWELEPRGGSRYILKCNGAVSVAEGHHLWASLTSDEGTTWKITKAENGEYIITEDFGDGGWVTPGVDGHPDNQVAVRRLLVFPTYPPAYPPTELFTIEKIHEDDE